MYNPPLTINVIERTDGTYTAFCPRMEPVHFSGKDRTKVIELAKAGIKSYLKLYPNFLDDVKSAEVVSA